MSRMLSLSIRVQFLLMICIMALPAAVSIVYSGIKLRQQAINEATQESRKLGDSIATEQKQLTASSGQLMSALAQLPEVKSHEAAGARKIFGDILKLNPQYLNVSVADTAGIVWASAVGTKPVSMSDRRYFKNAMATGQLSSGEYIVSRVTLLPTINLCYPFRNRHGVIAGAMIVALRLDQLSQGIEKTQLKRYSYVVFDQSGTILSRSINPEKSVGQKDDPQLFKRMQGPSNEGDFVGVGLDGKERFITYRKLYLKGEQSPYLYIRSGIPVDIVVAQANSVIFYNMVLFAAGLVLAFLLAWLIGKRSILDRIAKLQDASGRLAGGDLQVRVFGLVEGGEIGELGKAFDKMARHLADRERERDIAEAALRKSASRYRSIFDNSLFGIAVTGLDQRFTLVNEAFCQLLEYDERELLGIKGFVDVTHPDDARESLAMYHEMAQGELEYYTLEKRYCTKTGKVVRAACFVQGIYGEDGRYAGHSACILDVTELKASEERMRLFFERQLVGTAISSPERRWIITNEKLQSMLGFTGEELAGMTWEQLTYPEDLVRNVALFDQMLSGGIDAYSLETRFVRKDGTLLHTDVSLGCIRKHDGQFDCFLVMIDDISQRKEAEEEIRLLHLSLEQRVRERTRLLEAAIRELESFSYSVSHDLRSPLRHINSYLAILTEKLGDGLPGETRDILDRACAASVKMGKLIDDLLELSKVGGADIVKEQVDLSALATGIAFSLQETEPERVVEIVIAQDLWAQGDKNLLRLVLMNLLGNAWKYSSGKVQARLEFGAKVFAGQRAFFIRDNGAGFDMAYQDKLFGAFQRLHGDEYEGTGIGLATVKRIMERHGGAVWGESVVGAGATFYFSIPGLER